MIDEYLLVQYLLTSLSKALIIDQYCVSKNTSRMLTMYSKRFQFLVWLERLYNLGGSFLRVVHSLQLLVWLYTDDCTTYEVVLLRVVRSLQLLVWLQWTYNLWESLLRVVRSLQFSLPAIRDPLLCALLPSRAANNWNVPASQPPHTYRASNSRYKDCNVLFRSSHSCGRI